MKLLLALVPTWAWIAGAGALIATGAGWHYYEVRAARQAGDTAGAARVTALWDKAEIERERTANTDALRRAERAAAASLTHEGERAAIARRLQESRHALRNALRRPIQCLPGQSVAVGDVLVPADVLARVRDIATAHGDRERTDRRGAGKPDAAVRQRPTDPGR
jgi:hypothetical protein